MTESPPPISSTRWNARTKRIVVVMVLVLGGFFVWNVRGVLPLVIISTLLSYLLWPVVNFFERSILTILPFRVRSLAVLLTFVTVIASFTIFSILIAPIFVDQFEQIGDRLPEVLKSAEEEAETILNRPITIGGRPVLIDGEPVIPLNRIRDLTTSNDEGAGGEPFDIVSLVSTFLSSVSGLSAPVFSVLGGAVNFIVNALFMFVIMFYMMRDGDKFSNQIIMITPESYRGDVRRLFFELGLVWDAYLRGQLILCLSVGFAVYVAALVLGLPNALILGLLAGFLEFIPNFGPIIASIPAILIALVSQSSTIPILHGLPFALAVAITWTLIQNLEAVFLVPRVMGGSLNLHPVVVILAVIIGASVAGALGVILAAPITASARVFGQYFYGKLFDLEPFPEYTRIRGRLPARLLFAVIRLRPIRALRTVGKSRTTHQITEEINL